MTRSALDTLLLCAESERLVLLSSSSQRLVSRPTLQFNTFGYIGEVWAGSARSRLYIHPARLLQMRPEGAAMRMPPLLEASSLISISPGVGYTAGWVPGY